MQNVLIGGIGNELLGDHGIGHFSIKVLDSEYAFDSVVKLVEIPASVRDWSPSSSGADAVILIGAVDFGGQPGDIRLFRKHDMSPPFGAGKSEFVSSLQRMHPSPSEVLMIGMQGRQFNPGLQLSTPVRDCIPHVIDAVLRELRRLGVSFSPKPKAAHEGNWWTRTRRAA